jgi:hypothetical protein
MMLSRKLPVFWNIFVAFLEYSSRQTFKYESCWNLVTMSLFSEALQFFGDIGLFDVVLPFLLVFTIVFGVLEKSNVLGKDKKNLNAMVAFCTGFFVVASAQLVALISEFVAYSALVLVILIMFMILYGSLHSEQTEGIALEDGWLKFFTVLVVISLAFIFLNATGWLIPAWDFVSSGWNQQIVGTVALLLVLGGIMYFIVGREGGSSSTKKEGS